MSWEKMTCSVSTVTLLLGCTVLLVSLKMVDGSSSSPTVHKTSSVFENEGIRAAGRRILEVSSSSTVTPRTLYIITATTSRSAQPPDLTRMAQTLRLANNVHWVIVENATETSPWLLDLLVHNGLKHTVMTCPAPPPSGGREPTSQQKNCGLTWLRSNNISHGVIYFGDDGNAYDYRLFEELLQTRTVSVFPVGHTYLTGVASPIVQAGVVVDFMNPFPDTNGKFPVDWPGFAVDVSFWVKHGSPSLGTVKGTVQTTFLEELEVQLTDLQPLANNCTELLVWQLVTKNVMAKESFWTKKLEKLKGKVSNAETLYKQVKYMMP